MKTQPEALRLAELLDRLASDGPNWQVLELSADELRRLHAVGQVPLEALDMALRGWEVEFGYLSKRDPAWVVKARKAITESKTYGGNLTNHIIQGR